MKIKYTKTSNDNWQIDLVGSRTKPLNIGKIERFTFEADPDADCHTSYEVKINGYGLTSRHSLSEVKQWAEQCVVNMLSTSMAS